MEKTESVSLKDKKCGLQPKARRMKAALGLRLAQEKSLGALVKVTADDYQG